MRIVLTGNDSRAALLFGEISRQAQVIAEVEFDDIDPVTKYVAALLSYDRPRSEWWENYQMHPLIQRRRRKVLHRKLDRLGVAADCLLMWGSWFHPTRGRELDLYPFFNYIDQSRSLKPLPGEPPASILHRERSHRLQAETYAASRGIFCMSEWARTQTLDAHTIDPGKVHAVGWGPCSVDLSSEENSSNQRGPVILHVSNDFHRKGVDFLIATAERVEQAEKSARFVVIGQDVSKMTISPCPNVSFLGPMRGRDLEEQFRSATMFFLPHRFDRSPHVLVEAMSAGLPIVTSAQGGAMELISGKDTGYLVPIGDIDGYVNAIVSLLNSDTLRQRMGANGRKLMRAKYNWPAIARRILGLMESDLAGSRS